MICTLFDCVRVKRNATAIELYSQQHACALPRYTLCTRFIAPPLLTTAPLTPCKVLLLLPAATATAATAFAAHTCKQPSQTVKACCCTARAVLSMALLLSTVSLLHATNTN
jgi:hypothetical protein